MSQLHDLQAGLLGNLAGPPNRKASWAPKIEPESGDSCCPSGTASVGLRGVSERGVCASGCQCIVSLHCRTGSRTVTQIERPLLVEGRPNCVRQSLASTVSALIVGASLYRHPRRHAKVVTAVFACRALPPIMFSLHDCSAYPCWFSKGPSQHYPLVC